MKHINKLILFGLVLLASSCTNLDEEVFSEFTEDNFFQNDEQILSAFGAAYTSLYNYTGTEGIIAVQEISSDEMMVPTRGADWNDGGKWRRLHQHKWTSEDDAINATWNSIYGSVGNVNRLIFTFNDLEFEGKENVLAELGALRSIIYLWGMDLYGNIPIVTDFTDTNLPTQSTRAEAFSFIEGELLNAIGKVPTTSSDTYGRVNEWVVRAALAKLYINAEVYSGTARYADALAQCDAIINSGQYSFQADYASMFAPDNTGNPELIFAIPYDQVFAQGFNLVQQTLHYGSQATFNLTDQPWNGWCSLEEFYNSYEDGDSRKANNFLVGPQFSSTGERIMDTGAEATDPDGPGLTFTPQVNELGPNAFRQSGARVGKFEFEQGSTPNMNNDFPIYRYSDVLMMKAECHLRLNQDVGSGLDLVNQIRARAGVAPFGELTLDNLLAERGRELFFEAHRRSDLIRFGKFNDAWQFKDESDPHVNIFPIPRNQLDNNGNLSQNPGY